MPKGTSTSSAPQPARLSADEIKAAIRKIERRLADLNGLDPSSISTHRDPRVTALEASIETTLVDVFGPDSADFKRYAPARRIDRTQLYINRRPSPHEVAEGLRRGKEQAVALLEAASRALHEKLDDMGGTGPSPAKPFIATVDSVGGGDMLSRYHVAEVCLNGHATTDSVEEFPEMAARFCSTCGARTIRACPSCQTTIRGLHYIAGMIGTNEYQPPNHCHNCGAAFPWLATKMEAAKEHAAELEGLDEAERSTLTTAIEDIATDGPRAGLGATRIKRLLKKAGPVGDALYKLTVDIASEAAKKIFLGPGA